MREILNQTTTMGGQISIGQFLSFWQWLVPQISCLGCKASQFSGNFALKFFMFVSSALHHLTWTITFILHYWCSRCSLGLFSWLTSLLMSEMLPLPLSPFCTLSSACSTYGIEQKEVRLLKNSRLVGLTFWFQRANRKITFLKFQILSQIPSLYSW